MNSSEGIVDDIEIEESEGIVNDVEVERSEENVDGFEVGDSQGIVNDCEPWEDACRRILAKERVGLDDMTELEHVDDHAIAENLRTRLLEEQIYVSEETPALDHINRIYCFSCKDKLKAQSRAAICLATCDAVLLSRDVN